MRNSVVTWLAWIAGIADQICSVAAVFLLGALALSFFTNARRLAVTVLVCCGVTLSTGSLIGALTLTFVYGGLLSGAVVVLSGGMLLLPVGLWLGALNGDWGHFLNVTIFGALGIGAFYAGITSRRSMR